MTGTRGTLALITALASAGCAGRTEVSPFLIPAETFHETIHVVAALPTNAVVPSDCECAAQRAAPLFDSLVEGGLRSAGFTVVPATRTGELVRTIRDSIGPMYDARTGAVDSARVLALLASVRA